MPEIAFPTLAGLIHPYPVNVFPLRNVLSKSTSAEHARPDARLRSLATDGYLRFLEINAAALLPLGSALMAAGVQQLLPAWERRTRSSATLRDLARLGGAADAPARAVQTGRVEILGTLYVLEGIPLGAAHLLRQVNLSSDPRIRRATAFLNHGAGQHRRRKFLSILEGHAGSLTDEDHLVRPARRAFNLFAAAAGFR